EDGLSRTLVIEVPRRADLVQDDQRRQEREDVQRARGCEPVARSRREPRRAPRGATAGGLAHGLRTRVVAAGGHVAAQRIERAAAWVADRAGCDQSKAADAG